MPETKKEKVPPRYEFTCIRTLAFDCPCDGQGHTDDATLYAALQARVVELVPAEIQEACGQQADDIVDENGLPPCEAERNGIHWEVKTRIGLPGSTTWENVWAEDDGTPMTYTSKDAAEAELRDLLRTADQAFSAGLLRSRYTPEDYRIVEVHRGE